jgi:hypothetical protein
VLSARCVTDSHSRRIALPYPSPGRRIALSLPQDQVAVRCDADHSQTELFCASGPCDLYGVQAQNLRKGGLSMLRILIAIAAITLFVDGSQACSTCSRGNAVLGQQRSECQNKIVPKNLTGAANKSEWKKCMQDPDSYK